MESLTLFATIFVLFWAFAIFAHGALKTFQRSWLAALLLVLFLFPVWATWVFIELFTGPVEQQNIDEL